MKNKFGYIVFLLTVSTLLFFTGTGRSQTACDISLIYNEDTTYFPLYDTVCIGDFFELKVAGQDNCIYLWKQQGLQDTLSLDSTFIYSVKSSTDFTVTVIDTVLHDTCENQISVETFPEIKISFSQLQLTCTNGDAENGNNAVVRAVAHGEFDPIQYHYFWQVPPLHIAPNDSTLAIGLRAYQKYKIEVTDKHGCKAHDVFTTSGYPNPKVEIDADPDTAYIERPHISFSFENLSEDSLSISNFFWDFGDNTETSALPNPIHTYADTVAKKYTVLLTVFNEQGCDTVFDKEVFIEPVQLNIPNVFTPNKDGKNEVFKITVNSGGGNGGNNGGGFKSFQESDPNAKPLNTYFERSDLIILNRWGNKVFESRNYQNEWDGGGLPDGTYFYILKCFGYHKEYVYKGAVMIFTGGNN